MKILSKTFAVVVLGACAFTTTGVSAASLLGDSVDVTLSGGIDLQDLGVVVGPGIELQGGDTSTNWGAFLFPTESIDIGATSISMFFDLALGENAMLTFSDLDFGTGIGGVSLLSTIPEVMQANVSFTTDSITLDLTDWYFATDNPGTLELNISEVPLPAAFWLFASAIGGLGFLRRNA